MIKALALISGGLDSILSALLIKNQGTCPELAERIKVTGLAFRSLFFDAKNAKKLAKNTKIPLKIIDISKQHLKIVKHPKYGYGKRANPCIDCHLLMLKEAKKMMGKEGYHFIITGEVLGQRPFSQNKNALALIEKQADLKGLILRPLSAKLLPPTIPEKKGWVKREKLLGISGRSRKIQIKLAKKFKLKDFSTPGTSCILTDRAFTQRLFNLFKACPDCKPNDIHLLRLGRHHWVKATRLNSSNRTRLPARQDFLSGTRVNNSSKASRTSGRNKQSEISRKFGGPILYVIGRNHNENLQLKKFAQKKDILIEPKTFPGPTILIRSYQSSPVIADFSGALTENARLLRRHNLRSSVLSKAKKLLIKYSPKAPKKLSSKDFKIIIPI